MIPGATARSRLLPPVPLRAPRVGVGLALIALSAAVFLPFARAHFAWRDLADAYIHLVRIYAVHSALSSGDLYPRWLSDLYLGYGYPLLNFYAPATYYVGAFFRQLGATVYGSLQLLGALAVLTGATGAYALARGLGAPRPAALLAAAAYVLAPYPFLTNLYVRAAIPEALALGLAPWAFLAAQRAVANPTRRTASFLSLAVSLLILTHNVGALTTFPFLVAFALVVIARTGVARTSRFNSLAGGVAGGLALAAFFWLPALAESAYVQLDLLGGGIYDFRTWLFDPLRTAPADLSLAFDYSALDRAVPAKLSLVQLVLLGGATLSSIVTRRTAAIAPWLVVALTCLFLTTTWSISLWTHLPLLPLTQFPWRLHGLASLAIAIAIASSLALPPRVPHLGLVAVIIALLAWSSLPTRPLLFAPDPPHDVNPTLLASEEYNKYGAGTTSGGEFLPRTAQWGEGPRDRRRGIRVYDDLHPQPSWQAGLARVHTGRAALTSLWRTPHSISLDVDAAEPSTVALHQLAFPGWRAYLDGAPTPASIVPADPTLNVSLGFITVGVPSGPHHLELRFGSTPLRTAGAAISGAAAAILLFLGMRSVQPAAGPAAAPLLLAAALSAGCAAAAAELPGHLAAPRVASSMRATSDVIAATLQNRVDVTSPLGRGAGPMPPYVEPRFVTIGADTRRWLFLHPPSEVALPLTVPPDAYLQAGLAIDPAAWPQPVGDGVRFIAELEVDGRRMSLLDRTLDPRARLDDRRWIDVWADLRSHAGRTGRLILRTEARDEPSYDWAGWAHPQVVVWRSARPVPSAPHPW